MVAEPNKKLGKWPVSGQKKKILQMYYLYSQHLPNVFAILTTVLEAVVKTLLPGAAPPRSHRQSSMPQTSSH